MPKVYPKLSRIKNWCLTQNSQVAEDLASRKPRKKYKAAGKQNSQNEKIKNHLTSLP
jgi:hypothetical protein